MIMYKCWWMTQKFITRVLILMIILRALQLQSEPRIKQISTGVNHTNSLLVISFKTAINRPVTEQSYAIQNLKVFLNTECHQSCQECLANDAQQCKTCPWFAIKNSSNLCECYSHFFMTFENFTHCEECHISCGNCSGPLEPSAHHAFPMRLCKMENASLI